MLKKILLIDDDKDEHDFFLEALSRVDGSVCIYAESTDKGLAILTDITPDFIFVDVNMPRSNGLECLRMIKKIKKLDAVPVFIYSTSVDEEIYTKAHLYGAAGCIKKPLRTEILTDQLKTIMEILV